MRILWLIVNVFYERLVIDCGCIVWKHCDWLWIYSMKMWDWLLCVLCDLMWPVWHWSTKFPRPGGMVWCAHRGGIRLGCAHCVWSLGRLEGGMWIPRLGGGFLIILRWILHYVNMDFLVNWYWHFSSFSLYQLVYWRVYCIYMLSRLNHDVVLLKML